MKNKEKKGKKILITVISTILLSLLYVMIWGFSAQDGESSGGLSHAISEQVVRILDSLSKGDFTQEYREGLAAYLEHPIRKLAHFGEYAVMGILMFGIWRPWKKMSKKAFLLTTLVVFLSASVDEFHQLFTPGRSASFLDVLLDTCGGMFGLFLVNRVTLAFENRHRLRH